MVKAIFFDLGDTLTKKINIQKQIKDLLKPYNLNWKDFNYYWKSLYYLRSTGKISTDKEMFQLFKKIFKGKDIPFQKVKDIIVFNSHVIPEKNIKIIKELKKEYKIGLITNFVYEWVKTVFEKEKIDKLFDVIIVSSKIAARKPNAKLFYIALSTLSISPKEAVFVSDNLYEDLICARGCGIKTIWLNKKFKNIKHLKWKEMVKLFPPDAIIEDLEEIIPIIKNL
jgi:HAD superfamily hydrolase (TIGR01509 family)